MSKPSNLGDKLKKLVLVLISALANLAAVWVIWYFWKPIAEWYWNHRPVLGIDFYNFATYVGYFARHFTWRFNGWKYIWWGGVPLANDYPTLHAYLVLPLIDNFTLPQAIQIYMLASVLLFFFFAYLLFAELGRDKLLAVVLAVATSLSIGVYGALVMGGSLPYFASQMFVPLTFWALVKHFNRSDEEATEECGKRWWYVSAMAFGLSFLGHPQIGFSYLIPMVVLMLLFYPSEREKWFSLARFKKIVAYLFLVTLVGFPMLGTILGRNPVQIALGLFNISVDLVSKSVGVRDVPVPTLGSGEGVSSGDLTDINAFNREQVGRIVRDTHPVFFPLLAVAGLAWLLSLLIRKKRKNSLRVLAFGLPAAWAVFYVWIFGRGFSFYHGGWYRIFWPLPIVFGMLISFSWGELWRGIEERFTFFKRSVIRGTVKLLFGLIIVGFGFNFVASYSAGEMLSRIENPLYRQQSSAFPDSLSYYIDTKEEYGGLARRLVPEWLDNQTTLYRFLDNDQRVNVWWNALYDLPLVKGYTEVHPGDLAGYLYWMSIAIYKSAGNIESLVESWNWPPEIAYNNALFLIDWYSVKYLESEHEKADSFNPLTSYVENSDIFEHKEKVVIPGWAQLYQTTDGKIAFHPDEEEYLTYYQIREELVSPIGHPTDASVLGIIGSDDAYRTVVRALAATNLNSKRVIPIKLGRLIDRVSIDQLDDMDALVLYSYDYKSAAKAWDKLERYVDSGGKLFIETGSDVKETDSTSEERGYLGELPSVFPMQATRQSTLGRTWDLFLDDGVEAENIDSDGFGDPILDGDPWLFSLPTNRDSLRESAKVVLAAGDEALVIKSDLGKGRVIWSGMNLPFHLAVHKKIDEARFFEILIRDLVNIESVEYAEFGFQRESPQKVVISGTNSRGVLFREHAYPGWVASLRSESGRKSLRIYKAGPAYYGFMYVRIPDEIKGDYSVMFRYRGEFWTYFWQIVWLVVMVLLVDRILFGQRIFRPVIKKVYLPLKKRAGSWWEKEDDY